MDQQTTFWVLWITGSTIIITLCAIAFAAGGPRSTPPTQIPREDTTSSSPSDSGSTPIYAWDERLAHINMDVLNRKLYWDREGRTPYGRVLSTSELRERTAREAREASERSPYDYYDSYSGN